MFFVSIFSPPLAAAYAPTLCLPTSLIIEHMFIILPHLLCLTMLFTTLFDIIKGPVTSILRTSSKSLTSISRRGVLLIIPALLTSMSIIPTSFSILVICSSTAFSSVTSKRYADTLIPCPAYSFFAFSSFSADISLITIAAPAFASPVAIDIPRPCVPPVTRAILPVRSKSFNDMIICFNNYLNSSGCLVSISP